MHCDYCNHEVKSPCQDDYLAARCTARTWLDKQAAIKKQKATKAKVKKKVNMKCPDCLNHIGWESMQEIVPCPTCKGKGYIKIKKDEEE